MEKRQKMEDDPGGSIGGLDITFETDDPPQQVIRKLRLIFKRHWPLAAYEFDHTLKKHYDEEIFVYRNRYWRKKWDDDGAVPGTENTMFYFMIQGRHITFVIDSVNVETKPIIEDIISDIAVTPAQYTSGKPYSYAS
jgi:hypothetical protein